MTNSRSERVWRPDWPCQVGSALAPLRRGGGDPTYRVIDGVHHRGLRTPHGPTRLSIEPRTTGGEIRATAYGEGADWALDRLPRMLGAEDDISGFEPPERLAPAWRRHRHWRIGATGLVMEALVPAIIEQKVTGQEAFKGYRALVLKHGEPAPGPDLGLRVPPTPERLGSVPSWDWLSFSIDGARSRAIQAVARVASSLERAGTQPPEEFERRLRTLPGIGVWTCAEVRSRALGDADAVSFGDYHVAKDVTWALTGAEGDDVLLAELLEPHRPHRGRIPVLVALAGLRRPRRGPRMAPRTHLPPASRVQR